MRSSFFLGVALAATSIAAPARADAPDPPGSPVPHPFYAPPAWPPPEDRPGKRRPPPKPPSRANDPGMVAGGAVLTTVGGLAFGGSALFVLLGFTGLIFAPCEATTCNVNWTPIHQALVVGASGLGLVVAGIPLIAVGAKRVPIREPSFWDPPAVRVEAAGGGLRIRW